MLNLSVEMSNYIGKRKHVSQMTQNEIDCLFNRLKSVEANGLKWRVTGHTFKRIAEKRINVTYEDIVSLIHNAKILEYKINKNIFTDEPEERVLIISNSTVNRSYKLNVVFSLTERRIITTWVNHAKDSHATLDWSIYTPDMPVYGL